MAKPLSLPLYERVSCKGIMIRRTLDVTVFCLLLSLLAYRLRSLSNQGFTWLLAFLCESWFAFLWLLNLSTRWNPVEYKTYPENLLPRSLGLPPIDMFVTTADPVLEPPLVTVNTVLSLLAVDYPAEKLACYVSDDGCSPLTFYSLVEASKFAKLWVPFCKKYSIQIRAPFQYFSAKSLPPVDGLSGFELEWKKMKDEYEHLCRKIEDAVHKLMLGPHSTEYAVFKNIERDNHPSIVKVIFENKEDHSSCLPHLVYVSREKRPNHPHHFKAGAMNVLQTRVSGVMTNAPFMLNVDCDMFASNPKIILHAVCLLVGVDDEQECAFVQCPQIFYDALKDDPFGNRMTVPFTIFVGGMAGIQGPPYAGTGCFHRRKAIYGLPPNHDFDIKDCKILEERFGKSTEFSESVAEILFGSGEKHFPCDISSITGSACRVANCSYENNTCWGIEVGLTYGSVTEDVLTGLRIHTMGWKSVLLMPSPPAFMGCAPPGGPVSMTQMKRWGTGLLEVLFSKHSPILSAFSTKLHFRQALAYLQIVMWASRSIPQFCYNMLSAYCITTNSQFLPKVITIALSCIRTIDAEQMPCLLRFLLLSATQVNVRRIISQIREHLKFLSVPNTHTLQKNKLKGKLLVDNTEASILDALRSSLQFKSVLGALVTHVGSGVKSEVSSALQVMASLATKHAQELIPLSSHINGILDYLEGLTVENLHKVYEVFSHMALLARSSSDCFGSSIANELLIIVQKQHHPAIGQVSHPDLKYKKMGLIGILKIVSCLGDASNVTLSSPFQKSNTEEALELLETSLESCKQLCLSLIFFYDELTAILESRTLHTVIVDWIGKHVGEFESIFLSDLDGGQLPSRNSYCGLEGELWMNLDGEISPICLNILPLASSSQSACLQFLPANFHLLSAVERLTNQGSLGGIDALLGCPLLLPSSKYYSEAEWLSLTGKQKQIISLCLYYAVNWLRELLNAFCTQVAGRFEFTSQSTKEDITLKLLKRLRNLVFLESLLNHSIRMCPVVLPQLHLQVEHCGSTLINQPNHVGNMEKKNEPKMTHECTSPNKRKHKKIAKTSTPGTDGKLHQPTLMDVLRKAGVETSQEMTNEVSSKERTSASVDRQSHVFNESVLIEVSPPAQALESQKFRFRPLLLECFSILTFSKNHDSCCSDPVAELPLYLYLIHDLHCKLDYFAAPGKQCSSRSLSSVAFTRMTLDEFLSKIRPLFPSLKRNLDIAFCSLKEGNETCQEHWNIQSAAAHNPDIINLVPSKSSISTMVYKEVLHSFSKFFLEQMLNLPEVQRNKSVLSDLLEAFQPNETLDAGASDVQPCPSPGTIEYSYLGACSFVESILHAACSFSFILASEALFTLESAVTSVLNVVDKLEGDDVNIQSRFNQILPFLRGKLGSSAQKLLKHKWDDENLENGWKNKGEIVQKILRIHLEYTESTADLLDELACTILPQVSCTTMAEDEDYGYPTLCSATFLSWYHVLFEVNLTVLDKLVKEVVHLEKCRPGFQPENVHTHLIKMQKNVNVVVALVNMCRTYDKVTLHAMAVKYGGKFIDSFLKAFDFLQVHFQMHNEVIILLVKELQKATRTIQTLCSEAKGLKQTAITGKIPATKRSLERFLFRVKALLHTTSSGCTFWMGNLKHKDLRGQVVSSQAYVDDRNDSIDQDPEDVDPPVIVATASGNSETD
ncbi:PREDICTED: Fanconi anemia group D2 protein isoform X5 [Theobroma cacao]|uniref:Fanconi anemia group D2 protein isoform X5 n=1 Tax=Theobroma cacao TaxID=3641 RepID=A0AB32WHR2_THECC|nr:PREDICTED: Fanconi anemia group D2 protein isoform X5 [Theobroma cacao]